jgi:hypothetical protein
MCDYICTPQKFFYQAGVAQLVEHDLAKVGVASSSLVSRSGIIPICFQVGIFFTSPTNPFRGNGKRKTSSARVVELVDTQDLKSCGLNSCTGSIPVPGTLEKTLVSASFLLEKLRCFEMFVHLGGNGDNRGTNSPDKH